MTGHDNERRYGDRRSDEIPTAARRATLKDIAASLGLSVNTVSRALAGKDAVSEQTRARIRAEADRLGYVPNAMARSLVMGSAMALGLVITNPSNPFYARLVSAIEQRCRLHGYSLVLMVTEENFDTEERAATSLLRWGVDGAIAVPVQHGSEHWHRLAQAGVPLVMVNRDLPELDCDFVGLDYEGSAFHAARHLLDGGATRVLLVEEDLIVSSVDARVRGYKHAIESHDGCEEAIVRVPTRRLQSSTLPWDPEDAYQLARGIVRGLESGTAILTGSDYFALGIYRALQEAGRAVPDQIAVMGYGDHPFSAYLNPALSSVQLPAEEIGTTAVDLMIERLGSPRGPREPRRIELAPSLVIRDSTPR